MTILYRTDREGGFTIADTETKASRYYGPLTARAHEGQEHPERMARDMIDIANIRNDHDRAEYLRNMHRLEEGQLDGTTRAVVALERELPGLETSRGERDDKAFLIGQGHESPATPGPITQRENAARELSEYFARANEAAESGKGRSLWDEMSADADARIAEARARETPEERASREQQERDGDLAMDGIEITLDDDDDHTQGRRRW